MTAQIVLIYVRFCLCKCMKKSVLDSEIHLKEAVLLMRSSSPVCVLKAQRSDDSFGISRTVSRCTNQSRVSNDEKLLGSAGSSSSKRAHESCELRSPSDSSLGSSPSDASRSVEDAVRWP